MGKVVNLVGVQGSIVFMVELTSKKIGLLSKIGTVEVELEGGVLGDCVPSRGVILGMELSLLTGVVVKLLLVSVGEAMLEFEELFKTV